MFVTISQGPFTSSIKLETSYEGYMYLFQSLTVFLSIRTATFTLLIVKHTVERLSFFVAMAVCGTQLIHGLVGASDVFIAPDGHCCMGC